MKGNTTILISGCSIAGPALAFWLHRYGLDVTVVEKAHEIRRGGQAVDFKGAAHHMVLDRMGILNGVLDARCDSGRVGIMVNADGHKIGIIPAEFSAGEIEIARGDLSRILFERTAANCTYVFRDSIVSLNETLDGVEVTFQRSTPRVFDLVVGADGIHSNVRQLAFGPESDYVRYVGHYYALVNMGSAQETGHYVRCVKFRLASSGGSYNQESVPKRVLSGQRKWYLGWGIRTSRPETPAGGLCEIKGLPQGQSTSYANSTTYGVGADSQGNVLRWRRI
jgi:2-polyprenyl-6-methoxyphenol hydroxylase-like FAD-dependent oxidoreductase